MKKKPDNKTREKFEMKRIISGMCMLVLAGCAASPDPIKDDVASGMRSSEVAVAFAYPEKRIKYTELVYKVLWNEYQTTTANFDGIWDIETDLAAVYSQELREDGYPTTPLTEVVSESVYEGFANNAAGYDPVAEDKSASEFMPSRETREALLDRGFGYLLLVRGVNLNVYDQVMTNPQIGMLNYLSVHNLRTGEIDYDIRLNLHAKAELDGSARQLEENGLAGYREHLPRAVRELLASEDVQRWLDSADRSG